MLFDTTKESAYNILNIQQQITQLMYRFIKKSKQNIECKGLILQDVY